MSIDLRRLERAMWKSMDRHNAEKVAFAKANGYHIFNLKTKRCMFCDKTTEEIKRTTEKIEIEYEGAKLSVYPNCQGEVKQQ